MFVDASVIVAILVDEPGAIELEKRIDTSSSPMVVSPIVRFEAVLGVARAMSSRTLPTKAMIEQADAAVTSFIDAIGAETMPIDQEVGTFAVAAATTYGKAVGHPADLNLGDCYAYACAKARKLPLLYKGRDFEATDLA